MASDSFAERHPLLLALLIFGAVLLLGGGITYLTTAKGRSLLPGLHNVRQQQRPPPEK